MREKMPCDLVRKNNGSRNARATPKVAVKKRVLLSPGGTGVREEGAAQKKVFKECARHKDPKRIHMCDELGGG